MVGLSVYPCILFLTLFSGNSQRIESLNELKPMFINIRHVGVMV